ncbi:MAG: hypothetical protein NG737_07855 [Omnitrophica bacterium]|nr:hypothetical protein [Candidatus Omnitrophota bacterium]
MISKVFRITSNSDKYLAAEIIAEVLLRQISLDSSKPNAFFAVTECLDKISNRCYDKK